MAMISLLFAQEQVEAKQYSLMSIQELMNVEIKTPRMISSTIVDIPANVTIINQAEIRKFGYRNLTEILKNIHGFYAHDDWNFQGVNFGVRGYWSNQYNKNFVILVNGVTQRDNIFGWNVLESINVPAEAINRVEVIRGPMSVKYGSGAFFGVINIITNKPDKLIKQNLIAISYGNENSKKVFFRSAKDYDYFSYTLNASYFQTDGMNIPFKKVLEPVVNYDGQYIYNSNTKGFDSRINKHIEFSMEAYNIYSNFQYDETIAGFTAFVPPTISNKKPTLEMPFFRFALGYKNNFLNTKLDFKYTYIKNKINIDASHLIPGLEYGKESDPSRSWQIELNASTKFSNRDLFSYGFSFQRYEEMEIYDNFPLIGIHDYLHTLESPIDNYAGYLQYRRKLTSSLSFIAGVRVEKQNSYNMGRKYYDTKASYFEHFETYKNDEYILIPRLAAIYKIDKYNILKIMYGEGISRPSFFENHKFYGVYHPELVEQEIKTFEINYLSLSENKFSINASVYFNRIDNLIMRSIKWDGQNYLSYQDNIGEMETIGMEMQFTYQPKDDLKFDLALNFQRTRNIEINHTAGYAPGKLAYLKFYYHISDRLFFTSNINYVGRMKSAWIQKIDANNEVTEGRIVLSRPDYFLYDANFRYEDFPSKNMFLNLKVSNIFNTEYFYPPTQNNQWFSKGTMGEQRNILLTVGYSFD